MCFGEPVEFVKSIECPILALINRIEDGPSTEKKNPVLQIKGCPFYKMKSGPTIYVYVNKIICTYAHAHSYYFINIGDLKIFLRTFFELSQSAPLC